MKVSLDAPEHSVSTVYDTIVGKFCPKEIPAIKREGRISDFLSIRAIVLVYKNNAFRNGLVGLVIKI
jgi:hypothetical protein